MILNLLIVKTPTRRPPPFPAGSGLFGDRRADGTSAIGLWFSEPRRKAGHQKQSSHPAGFAGRLSGTPKLPPTPHKGRTGSKCGGAALYLLPCGRGSREASDEGAADRGVSAVGARRGPHPDPLPQAGEGEAAGRIAPAAFAQALDLDDLALGEEARLRGGRLQKRVEAGALDLVGAPAAAADQQDAVVIVAEMGARGIGVAALDLVKEAMGEEEFERAIAVGGATGLCWALASASMIA